MRVELISVTKGVGKYSNLNIEEIVSAISRHGIIKEDNGKLIKYLMDHKHVSPLQHVSFGFEIETSRAIGRQLLRHSSLEPQERSLRYSESMGYEPIVLRKEHPTNRQSSTEEFDPIINLGDTLAFEKIDMPASEAINMSLEHIHNLYLELIKAGVARETARFILPECATTVMTFTGNLRNWLAFLNLRMDPHSQAEATEIATLVGEAIEKEMPNLFSRIEWRKGLFL